MLPVLTGITARRVLLNFRAPVEAVRPLVPSALDVVERRGEALLGVCLIRLEKIRPRGLPACGAPGSRGEGRSGGQVRSR